VVVLARGGGVQGDVADELGVDLAQKGGEGGVGGG